jgi:hypothetical protein
MDDPVTALATADTDVARAYALLGGEDTICAPMRMPIGAHDLLARRGG